MEVNGAMMLAAQESLRNAGADLPSSVIRAALQAAQAASPSDAGTLVRESQLIGLYMEFDRHVEKGLSPSDYLLRWGAYVMQRCPSAERTFVDHSIVRFEYPNPNEKPRPSDQSIAMAVFGGCHCQYHPHGYADCATFAWILDEAERIERGEKSHYETESERYAAMSDNSDDTSTGNDLRHEHQNPPPPVDNGYLLPPTEEAIKSLYNFGLTREAAEELAPRQCKYCGSFPKDNGSKA